VEKRKCEVLNEVNLFAPEVGFLSRKCFVVVDELCFPCEDSAVRCVVLSSVFKFPLSVGLCGWEACFGLVDCRACGCLLVLKCECGGRAIATCNVGRKFPTESVVLADTLLMLFYANSAVETFLLIAPHHGSVVVFYF